jgi:predicted amidohydrolase YtcJ
MPFAKKMVGRLSRGSKANKKNPAYKFLGEFTPKQEWGTMATKGPSLTTVLSDNPVYLRRLSRKELLWVSPAGDASAKPGDGTYGEFWLVIW